jgi:hypothetical protein
MKTIIAPLALFALAACGSSTDASEDATADTVEIPADQALSGAPDPVADPAANVDAPAEGEAAEGAAAEGAPAEAAPAAGAQAAADAAATAAGDAAAAASDAAAE